jgi:hypothetical protein
VTALRIGVLGPLHVQDGVGTPIAVGDLFGGDGWSTALMGLSDGLLQVLGGEPAAGEATLRDTLARFRALGERWGTAQALDGLALVASWRGDWALADERWSAALAAMGELGALEECADLLCRRAESELCRGDLDAAAADLLVAQERWASAGRPGPGPAAALAGLGELARRRGDVEEARELLAAADAAARDGDFGAAAVQARALGTLARLAADDAEAADLYRGALAAVRRSPLRSDLADAADRAAGAAARAGDLERSALLLGAAVALRGTAVAGETEAAEAAGAVRSALGPSRFARAFARGAALQPATATALLDSR